MIFMVFFVQKQLSRGVLRKRCSENMQQIYRKTPMPKCDLNKVSQQLFTKQTLILFLARCWNDPPSLLSDDEFKERSRSYRC